MPGSATWERASAASAIRRISAKQPTRPAATAMATGSASASGLMDVVIHGRPVHLVEDVGREDRPRRPQARLAPAQAQHGGRVPVDDGQLVRDEEDREPLLLLEAPRQLVQALLPRLVDAGGRLVEQEDGRVAGEGEGDEQALELATRQRPD